VNFFQDFYFSLCAQKTHVHDIRFYVRMCHPLEKMKVYVHSFPNVYTKARSNCTGEESESYTAKTLRTFFLQEDERNKGHEFLI
jgi:hypothetical protein